MTESIVTPQTASALKNVSRKVVKLAIVGALATAAVVAVQKFRASEDATGL